MEIIILFYILNKRSQLNKQLTLNNNKLKINLYIF